MQIKNKLGNIAVHAVNCSKFTETKSNDQSFRDAVDTLGSLDPSKAFLKPAKKVNLI